MKNKKEPSKLHEWNRYDFNGKVSDLIAQLQIIVDKHPNATIESELNWDACYYEGDTPEIKFVISSK